MSILDQSSGHQQSPLLTVEDLCMYFNAGGYTVKAAEKVSFYINGGETYGLVGESGSGKSTIGKCVIRLYDPTSGRIIFDGKDISGHLNAQTSQTLRNGIQMIFQDPMSSLNPRKSAADIVGEGLDIHHMYKTKEERQEKILKALSTVGLSKEQSTRYPAQFSGGQRQRLGIARALIMQPKLIIADECIAALDVSIQAQVVNMLRRIKEEYGTSFLFISHDLSMVRYLSDRIGVLHLGYMLETGTSDQIFENPVHPYTKSLLSAIPSPNPLVQARQHVYYNLDDLNINYSAGSWHDVEPGHTVWCTDADFKSWRTDSNEKGVVA